MPRLLPDTWAVALLADEEFNAWDYVRGNDADAEARARRFDTGEMTAYVVQIVERDDFGNAFPNRSILAQVDGVAIADPDLDGATFDRIEDLPSTYIREVTMSLVGEAEAGEENSPRYSRAELRELLKEIKGNAVASSDLSGALADDETAAATPDEHESWGAFNAHRTDAELVLALIDKNA